MAVCEFPKLNNDALLRAARGEPVEFIPAWVMRQAGRYLPEFRKTRSQCSFFELCRTPELACEVTLQPIKRFGKLLDAAIIFSDILVVPQALGQTVDMVEGKGPVFADPLNTPDDLDRLNQDVDVSSALAYVYDAIKTTRKALQGAVPLFGFAGAPWTIMAYMIEGGGSKTLSKAKKWLFLYHEASHQLLSLITKVTIAYLVEQARAGAQILQVFDSWAGELSPHHFAEFAFPYLQQIAEALKKECPEVPVVVFARNANAHALPLLARETKYDVFGLDFAVDFEWAYDVVVKQNGKVVQGNMDPSCLFGTDQLLESEVSRILAVLKRNATSDGRFKGYIANMGHGMYPNHTPEKLLKFLQCYKSA